MSKEAVSFPHTWAAAAALLLAAPAARSAQVGQEPPPPTLEELAHRVDLLEREIENTQLGAAAPGQVEGSVSGLGKAASKVYGAGPGVSIGGYGELLYQNFAENRDDGRPSGAGDNLDLLRAVLYFGYKFDENWLFNSEFEFEHATTSSGRGEASVEFAYLDYLHAPALNARAGLLLLPMGFVNEMHEPTAFYGALRPQIEQRILPTTWRENGAGVWGECGDFRYRSYVVNGFDGLGFNSSGLRGGRQKGGRAKAADLAWVGRLDWEGAAGLLVGASAYYGGSGQDAQTPGGDPIAAGTAIVEAHAQFNSGGWQFRGLYALADVNQADRLNRAVAPPLAGNQSIGEELEGWYLEAGFDLLTLWDQSGASALTPFLRWEEFDTQAEVPAGYARNPARDVQVLTLGCAWQPMDQIIVKADWQNYEDEANTSIDQFNVALGWIF